MTAHLAPVPGVVHVTEQYGGKVHTNHGHPVVGTKKDAFGTLGATEAADTAAITGLVGLIGTLAATETADIAAFNGLVGLTGTLAATEGADVAAFAGTVAFPAITGTLDATETADSASFTGTAVTLGTLAAIEDEDAAAFAGLVGLIGTLDATEAADTAAFTGTVAAAGEIVGSLNAVEGADTAAFTGIVEGAEVVIGGGGGGLAKPLIPFPVTGTGYGILPELEGEAHGVVIAAGGGVGMLPGLPGVAAGVLGVAGRSAAQLIVHAEAIGDRGEVGAAVAVLKGLSVVESAGAVAIHGTGSGMIAKPEGAAIGWHDDDEAAVMTFLLAA